MAHLQENCPDNELVIIKKGFSGEYAIGGFFIACFISYLLIRMLYPNGNIDSITYTIASILITLSLFAGTIKMNKLYSVCPKCGKKREL